MVLKQKDPKRNIYVIIRLEEKLVCWDFKVTRTRALSQPELLPAPVLPPLIRVLLHTAYFCSDRKTVWEVQRELKVGSRTSNAALQPMLSEWRRLGVLPPGILI